MACEYCDSTEELFNTQNLVMFLDGNRSMQADVLYDPDNYLWESFVVNINYCPMCGEKLGDSKLDQFEKCCADVIERIPNTLDMLGDQ